MGKAFKVHFARTTIARERKKAVKQSQSPLLGGRQSTSPQMRRVQSLSPQPLRRNTSSPQPPAGAIPPYNPNLPHTGIERSSSNNFYCTPQQVMCILVVVEIIIGSTPSWFTIFARVYNGSLMFKSKTLGQLWEVDILYELKLGSLMFKV